ncbi:protease-associated domain-containing protein 1-like [Styela clava]|uniref:protease-associated domain-containing protein 1-like n=1 Tax=Styela clava TaxID=7725 RepID=UPI00193A049B|nr:protease-associated domain-containing protein 1-like [Styela clava]
MGYKIKKFMLCLTLAIVVGCCLQQTFGYGVHEQLWLHVIYPEELSYYFKILPAKDFGGVLDRPLKGIPMIVADPWEACTNTINNGNIIRGRVVLVRRGECSFVTKSLNMQKHGAKAIVITNYNERDIDTWIDMSDDATGRVQDVTIPTFYLLGMDGHKMKQVLSDPYRSFALVNIPANVTNPSGILQPKWDIW